MARRRQRRPGRFLSLIVLALLVVGGIYLWRQLPSRAATYRNSRHLDAPRRPAPGSGKNNGKNPVRPSQQGYQQVARLLQLLLSQSGAGRDQSLELWKNYDIKEVTYRISNVQRVSDKEATADIVWNIQLYDHRTHDYTLVRQKYQTIWRRVRVAGRSGTAKKWQGDKDTLGARGHA